MNVTHENTWEDFKFSPSRHDGISEEIERFFRYEACKFIDSFGKTMGASGKVRTTACGILHQFYFRASFRNYRRFEIALACLTISLKMDSIAYNIDKIAERAIDYFRRYFRDSHQIWRDFDMLWLGKDDYDDEFADVLYFWTKRIRDYEIAIYHRLNGETRCIVPGLSIRYETTQEILRKKYPSHNNGNDKLTDEEAHVHTRYYMLSFSCYAMRSIIGVMYPPPWIAAACYFLFVRYYNQCHKNDKSKQVRLVPQFWKRFYPNLAFNLSKGELIDKNKEIINENNNTYCLDFNLLQYLSDEILSVCDDPCILSVLNAKRKYFIKPSELIDANCPSIDLKILEKMHQVSTQHFSKLDKLTKTYLKDSFYFTNFNNDNDFFDLRQNKFKYPLLYKMYRDKLMLQKDRYWNGIMNGGRGVYYGDVPMVGLLENRDLQERNKHIEVDLTTVVSSLHSNESIQSMNVIANKNRQNKSHNNNNNNTNNDNKSGECGKNGENEKNIFTNKQGNGQMNFLTKRSGKPPSHDNNNHSMNNSSNNMNNNNNNNNNRRHRGGSKAYSTMTGAVTSRSSNKHNKKGKGGQKRSRKEFDRLRQYPGESIESLHAKKMKIAKSIRLRQPMSEKEVFENTGWNERCDEAPMCLECPFIKQHGISTQCHLLMENLFDACVIETCSSVSFTFNEKKGGYFEQDVYFESSTNECELNQFKKMESKEAEKTGENEKMKEKEREKKNENEKDDMSSQTQKSEEKEKRTNECDVQSQEATLEKQGQEDETKNKGKVIRRSDSEDERVIVIYGFDCFLISNVGNGMDIFKLFEIFSHFGKLLLISLNKENEECILLYNEIVDYRQILSYMTRSYIHDNFQFSMIKGLSENDDLRKNAQKLHQEKESISMNNARAKKKLWQSIFSDTRDQTENDSSLMQIEAYVWPSNNKIKSTSVSGKPAMKQSIQTGRLAHRRVNANRNVPQTSVTSIVSSQPN